MRREVWYKAIDPYYSDQVQTFISSTHKGLDEQEYDFEKWLGREHPCGIRYIYKTYIIYESDCSEMYQEVFAENRKKYLESKNSKQ